MDRNFVLAFVLSLLVMITWSVYTAKQHPPKTGSTPTSEATQQGEGGSPQGKVAQQKEKAPVEPAPSAPAPEPAQPAATRVPAGKAAVQVPTDTREKRISIQNPLFHAVLTSHGGGLVQWQLQKFTDPSQPGRPRVSMVTPDQNRDVALATPFTNLGFGDWSKAPFAVSRPNDKTVVFTREQGGVRVRKTYLFDPDHYVFRLHIELHNGSSRDLRPTFRVTWPATTQASADYSDFSLAAYVEGHLKRASIKSSHSFFGFGGGSFDKVQEYSSNVDWAGAQTRYFLSALMPDSPSQAAARFDPAKKSAGKAAFVEVAFQGVDVPPGQGVDREYRVYIGPKEPERLDSVGAHLDEAILRGWFPRLTRFFTWVLTATHSVIPNYGVAIILITVLVRLLMWPLMSRQTRSMKRMATLQPRIKEIQKKYPDDRQKQSEAMMGVYKEAGVHPLSMVTGCLPMILQLPVFLGFYYALLSAIQLRQQPFFGWITDLSAPESLFTLPVVHIPVRVLPLLMGGSMVLQQRVTPSTMDAAQARMMMTIMPVVFTVLFYQFASGLVLYWLFSTLLGILQQVITNRQPT